MVLCSAAVNNETDMALIILTYIIKYLRAKSLKNQVNMTLVYVGGTYFIKYHVYQQILENLMR